MPETLPSKLSFNLKLGLLIPYKHFQRNWNHELYLGWLRGCKGRGQRRRSGMSRLAPGSSGPGGQLSLSGRQVRLRSMNLCKRMPLQTAMSSWLSRSRKPECKVLSTRPSRRQRPLHLSLQGRTLCCGPTAKPGPTSPAFLFWNF